MIFLLLILVAIILILIIFAGVGNALILVVVGAVVFALVSFILKKLFNRGQTNNNGMGQ